MKTPIHGNVHHYFYPHFKKYKNILVGISCGVNIDRTHMFFYMPTKMN
ncbi:protein of unknown function [Xenorhabdus poinarii G6]|uniref:Uncharacterized protein n=1 Tax=Xenorhabdus poinarii G6 TaxID=1354304 RepID=A0A068R4P3_9GAMM|nr:protein of unknown function [Xenorhabdus poinarii G6]